MASSSDDRLTDFLMGPFSRWLEAVILAFNPWLLLWEQPAVEDTSFALPTEKLNVLLRKQRCTDYPDCPQDGTDCHFEREWGVNCDQALMGVRMPEANDE